jgi:hypothetical protein
MMPIDTIADGESLSQIVRFWRGSWLRACRNTPLTTREWELKKQVADSRLCTRMKRLNISCCG